MEKEICVFCKNVIAKGAEIIDAKKIIKEMEKEESEMVLTRKMVKGINPETAEIVHAHALCFSININRKEALHTHAVARIKSDDDDILRNAQLSAFITEKSTEKEVQEWKKLQAKKEKV